MNSPGDFIFQCSTRTLFCIDNSFQRFVFYSRVLNYWESSFFSDGMNVNHVLCPSRYLPLLCQVQHLSPCCNRILLAVRVTYSAWRIEAITSSKSVQLKAHSRYTPLHSPNTKYLHHSPEELEITLSTTVLKLLQFGHCTPRKCQ
jgi:hypothetical protein